MLRLFPLKSNSEVLDSLELPHFKVQVRSNGDIEIFKQNKCCPIFSKKKVQLADFVKRNSITAIQAKLFKIDDGSFICIQNHPNQNAIIYKYNATASEWRDFHREIDISNLVQLSSDPCILFGHDHTNHFLFDCNNCQYHPITNNDVTTLPQSFSKAILDEISVIQKSGLKKVGSVLAIHNCPDLENLILEYLKTDFLTSGKEVLEITSKTPQSLRPT